MTPGGGDSQLAPSESGTESTSSDVVPPNHQCRLGWPESGPLSKAEALRRLGNRYRIGDTAERGRRLSPEGNSRPTTATVGRPAERGRGSVDRAERAVGRYAGLEGYRGL